MNKDFDFFTIQLMALACLYQSSGSIFEISLFINKYLTDNNYVKEKDIIAAVNAVGREGYIIIEDEEEDRLLLLPEGKNYFEKLYAYYKSRINALNIIFNSVGDF